MALLIINSFVNFYLIACACFLLSLSFDDDNCIHKAFKNFGNSYFPNAYGNMEKFTLYQSKQAYYDIIAKCCKIIPLYFTILYVLNL